MQKKTIEKIFSRFAENKPDPRIELDHCSPYTLLVAVVLSAQSTDKGVNRVTPALFEVADTPEKMVELGEEGLKSYIKSIGLYNNKAKNIIALSKILVEKYNSQVPAVLQELKSLPGVGSKSAKVILNCIWGQKVIAVDTHIFRIANRIGLCATTNALKTEIELEKIVPKKWQTHAHHWLVLHGRYVCKARKPQCRRCIIEDLCQYKDKNYSL
jgi:endonuclease-3